MRALAAAPSALAASPVATCGRATPPPRHRSGTTCAVTDDGYGLRRLARPRCSGITQSSDCDRCDTQRSDAMHVAIFPAVARGRRSKQTRPGHRAGESPSRGLKSTADDLAGPVKAVPGSDCNQCRHARPTPLEDIVPETAPGELPCRRLPRAEVAQRRLAEGAVAPRWSGAVSASRRRWQRVSAPVHRICAAELLARTTSISASTAQWQVPSDD